VKTDPTSSLSQRLAQLFEQGFFRPLARPSAQLYVDCADRLELASDEGGQPWEGEPLSSTLCDWLGEISLCSLRSFAAKQVRVHLRLKIVLAFVHAGVFDTVST